MDVHNLRELENFMLTVTLDYFTFYLVCLLNHMALLLKMKENTPETSQMEQFALIVPKYLTYRSDANDIKDMQVKA
jgi:hypothetical protein